MALIPKKAPAAALRLLKEALGRAYGPLGGAAEVLARVAPQELDTPEPLPVYVTTPRQILSGSFLKNATLRGWSYTVFRQNTPLAGAEIAQDFHSTKCHFSHFSEGPFVKGLVEAVAHAEAFSHQSKLDLEPRLLRCPALYLVALWLHSTQRDVFIPMSPTRRNLVVNHPYDRSEFDEWLLEAAQESLSFEAQVAPRTEGSSSDG